MWTREVSFGGFSFYVTGNEVTNNNPFEIKPGIIVDPKESDFDNPDYIKALRAIRDAYPVIEAFARFNGIIRNKYWDYNSIFLLQDLAEILRSTDIPAYKMSVDMEQSLIEYERAVTQEPETKPKPIHKPGYVYLLRSEVGFYKIGKTKYPNQRISTFNLKLPFAIECLCLIKTSDMNSLEKGLHKKYAEKRVNGEWFDLSSEDVEYIIFLSGKE